MRKDRIELLKSGGFYKKMNNINMTEPIVPQMQSDPSLKEYYCPHCDKLLFKGNIKKLNMVCHHCQKLINADENELIKVDIP
jgi:acetyl-CoA carboxylase beta subunit